MSDRKVTKKMQREGATCSICRCPFFFLYRMESDHKVHPDLRECVEALGVALIGAHNMAGEASSRAAAALLVANGR